MSCCQASFCRTSPTEGGAGKGQIFLYVLLRFFMAELRIPMIVIDDSGIVAAYSGHRDRWSGRRHGLPDKLYDCLIRGAFQPPPVLPGERQLWLADEGVFFVRAVRSDSPLSTIRCACGSRRSSIASATAGSSIQACQ